MTWQERQAQLAAEEAAWPERYPVVADLMQLGFCPDAYGLSRDEPIYPGDLMSPPTQFHYPPAGFVSPDHVDRHKGHGSLLMIWSFTHDRPTDELAEQPIWHAGVGSRAGNHFFGLSYPSKLGTLRAMAAWVVAYGAWLRRHFIIPDWSPDHEGTRGFRPAILPLDVWRELAAVDLGIPRPEPQPGDQLSLFADPDAHLRSSPLWDLQQEITRKMALYRDDMIMAQRNSDGLWTERYLHPLIELANQVRLTTAPAFVDPTLGRGDAVACPVCEGEKLPNGKSVPCALRRHGICVNGLATREAARNVLYFMADVNAPAWGQPCNGDRP